MCSYNLLVVLTRIQSNHSLLFSFLVFFVIIIYCYCIFIIWCLIQHQHRLISSSIQCCSKVMPWWFSSDCRSFFCVFSIHLSHFLIPIPIPLANVIFSLVIFTRCHIVCSHTNTKFMYHAECWYTLAKYLRFHPSAFLTRKTNKPTKIYCLWTEEIKCPSSS